MFYGSTPNDHYRVGEHVCLPVTDRHRRAAALVTFTREGLRHDQKILLLSDSPPPSVLLNWLTMATPEFRAALSTGQLTVGSAQAVYLPGGRFDPDDIVATFTAATDRAADEGYRALRVTNDMTWCRRDRPAGPSIEALAEYEARVNALIIDGRILGVCQYNPNRFDRAGWMRIVSAHPTTISPIGDRFISRLRGERTEDPPGLRLVGEADFANRDALPGLLKSAATRPGPFFIDTAGLSFAEVHAMVTLVDVARRRRRGGLGPTTIVCTAQVARVLDIIGATSVDGLSIVTPTGGRLALTDADRRTGPANAHHLDPGTSTDRKRRLGPLANGGAGR